MTNVTSYGQKHQNRAGLSGYVAEIGAAFLCGDLELEPQIRDDHAPYLAGWLKALRSDKRAIFTAAAYAQRAVDFLHGLHSSRTFPATS
jgi:antirestriction protein ArdC